MELIQDRINGIIQEKKTVYVLLGFNAIYESIKINCEKLLDTNVEQDILNLEKYDSKKAILELTNKLIQENMYYCFMEEFVYLSHKQLIGNIEAFGYKIKIIKFNIYNKMVANFSNATNKKQYLDMIDQFDDYEHGNFIQQIYTKFECFDDTCIVQYNSYKSESVQEMDFFQFEDGFKLEDHVNITIDEDNNESITSDITNEKLTAWITRMLFSNKKKIYVSKENCIQNDFLLYVIQCFVKLDYDVVYITTSKKSQIINKPEYLEILKRKNSNYVFRDIDIYEKPDIDNSIIKINQEQIVHEIVRNVEKAQKGASYRDIFVTAPTGAGKSILFQIPAIHLAEKYNLVTIIVSPLIGLMNDQVNNIKDMTNLAETINSDYTPMQKEVALNNIKKGTSSILYLSPESLLSNASIENLIGEREVGLIVIDEAHTVATWGKSFRPDYWYLGEYIYRLRGGKGKHKFPITTFTATATYGGSDNMYLDIVDGLKMTPISFIGNVKREDINFRIELNEKDNDYQREKIVQAVETLEKLIRNKEKTLVYFPFKATINQVYSELSADLKDNVGIYHAGINKIDKDKTYKQFRDNKLSMVFATKAFGMGIDIEDIVKVYHFAPTGNISDYVQEIGRSARKPGLKGVAFTDYYKEDYRYINQLYGMSRIKDHEIIGVLNKILHLYHKYNKRNFMVAPQEFSHIFNVKEDRNIDGKLKTTLLIIKKDFELADINFVPLVFKPRSMFTKGYFLVKDEYINKLKKEEIYKFFNIYKDKNDLKQNDGSLETTYMGDVYELDFKRLWENNYRDISFGSFKYKFFTGDLDEIQLSENIIPELLLNIEVTDGNIETAIGITYKVLKQIRNILDELKITNKHYSYDDIASYILKEIELVNSLSMAKMVAENVIYLINAINGNTFNSGSFFSYNNKTDKIKIKNSYYNTKISTLKKALYKKLNSCKNLKKKTFLIANPSGNKIKTDPFLLGIQIMEIFGLLSYEIKSGDLPEFFIRVNSETAIRNIINNEYYRSKTLDQVQIRHEDSVKNMKIFFEELKGNNERWDFIEDYFLGRLG